MLSQIKRIFRWVMLPAVMLAFFLITAPVLAEGEAPPEPNEGEAILVEQAAEPITEAGTVEEPAVTEPVPVDPVVMDPPEDPAIEQPVEESNEVVVETPLITEVIVEDAQDLAETTAALADSDLVLSDPGGEVLDMASEDTAELITSTDPYFFYGGIKYVWVLSGQPNPCGSDPACMFMGDWANPISQVITYLGEHSIVPTDKKIYVESGIYAEAISIDGNDSTISALTGLTYGIYLRQLNGLIGMSTPTQPVINGTLTISNMAAGFTLSNFEINNAVKFADNTGTVKVENAKIKNTSGNGLHIYGQKGAVELSNVKMDGNKYSGALIESGAGKFTLKITISTFNDNGIGMASWYTGLQVDNFLGAITIDGMSANRNNGYGAFISDSPASVTIKNSTFNDTVSVSTSNGKGLYLNLDNASPVTLENISAFRNEQNYGIHVITKGAVTAKNIRAEGNRNAGMYIDNSGAGLSPVVVSNSIFSNNKLTNAEGLVIYSYGPITISSVRAENNTGTGVHLDNCISSGGSCMGSGSVTINSPAASGDAAANVFKNNAYDGLVALSRGVISLFNFHADDNDGGAGAYLYNLYSNSTAGITVNANIPNDIFGKMWVNSTSHNYYGGLVVQSHGAVSVTKVQAYANRVNNIEIDNWDVPDTAPKSVTVNYVDTDGYDGSAFVSDQGLMINTKGNVTINNIIAVEHAYDGVNINACQYDGGKCLGSGSVTIKSTGSPNIFSNNGYTGISVFARGNISIYNFLAKENGYSGSYKGVYVTNDYSNGSGTITIDANLPQPFVNEISGNTSYGLHVKSKGAILLGRSLIKNNGNSYGAYLISSASTDLPVTVRFSELKNNNGYGLLVASRGLITLTNVISENNTGSSYGAYLDNTGGKGGVTVNTSGTFTNSFSGNYYEGLIIRSNGAVVVLNTLAQGNGNSNINIDNRGALPSAPKPVTLTNVSTDGRNPLSGLRLSNYGVYIYSLGAVKLTKVATVENKYEGIYIWLETTQSAITLSNCTSTDNGGYGYSIYGMGNVTLSSSSADNNSGGYGAFIDNCRYSGGYCTGTGGVTVNAPFGKYISFSENGDTGLTIYSGGNVSLTNIKAENNEGLGASVYQMYNKLIGGVDVAQSGNVTVVGSGVPCLFNGNDSRGLYVLTYGNVTVTNADMKHNKNYGLAVDNYQATASPTVSLTDINANFNWNDGGIAVQSKGIITLKGIDANDNNVLVGEIWDGRQVFDHLSHTAGEDQWWFSTTGAYSVSATLKSIYFDAFLCLYKADGSQLTCDSDSGGSGNSWINGYGLAEPGDYYLAVRSESEDGNAGGYDLTLGSLTNTDYFYTTGIWLDNSYSTTNAAISISPSARGYGLKANDNIGNGVYIASNGKVSITKAWADNNYYTGLSISNTSSSIEAGITLNTVYADGNIESGSARGMRLISMGPVSITTVFSNQNRMGGIEINNSTSTKFAAVTISGLTVQDNQGSWPGLSIETTGVVNLTNIVSTGNGIGSSAPGIEVDNCQDSSMICAKNVNVNLSGTLNQFSNNSGNGLTIFSGGLITLNNFTASKNTGEGLYLYNDYVSSLGVTIKRIVAGVNEIMANGSHGMRIFSDGAVWVEKLKSVDNVYTNITIDNQTSGTPKTLTVKGVWVENSGTFYNGMSLESSGAVLLDGIKARANGYFGVTINNSGASAPVTVLRGTFDFNKEDGLDISATGDITLGGITARANAKDGVSATSGNGKVVVSALYGDNIFNGNGTYGVTTGSGIRLYDIYGSISIERVFAWENSSEGIHLDNYTGSNPGGVITVKNVNLARNLMDGLYINPLGNITISGAIVTDNGGWTNGNGIHVEGFSGLEPNVTINSSRIMGNYGYGIYLWEVNTVTISNVLNIGNDANGDNLSSEDNYYVGP